VDDDKVAADIIGELNKRGGGRVTFMPLSRLKPSLPELPPSSGDAIVMIDRLEFDEKYRKAFQQVGIAPSFANERVLMGHVV
jgi:structural maintenance of chromosome 3 (chondroitin sulfate proteoglycan 6)